MGHEAMVIRDRKSVQDFQALVADLDYPMFVVTVSAHGKRAGCLVGFASQCSIDPARFLICISKRNHTFNVAVAAQVLALHFLGTDDLELARLFGEETGDKVDKFARCQWEPGPHDVPILRSCRGWAAGTIIQRFDLGDHLGLLWEPFTARKRGATTPLGFQQARQLRPGHEA